MARPAGRLNRLANWITTTPQKGLKFFRQLTRKDSLLRTVMTVLVLAALIPVVLNGVVSYLRTRGQILRLVTNQMANISTSAQTQLADYITSRGNALENLVATQEFTTLMAIIANPKSVSTPEASSAPLLLRNYLVTQSQSPGEPLFDQIVILDETGALRASSDSQWVNDNFGQQPPGQDPRIKSFLKKEKASDLLYSPFAPWQDRFVVVTQRTITFPPDQRAFNVIAFSSSRIFSQVLEQTASFFPEARSYYFFSPQQSLLSKGDGIRFSTVDAAQEVIGSMTTVIKDSQARQPISYTSLNGVKVLGFIRSIPSTKLFLILEVPNALIFSSVPLLDTFNLYMIGIGLMIFIFTGYLTSNLLINPLVNLSDIARSYAAGSFHTRAKANRNDEIGQLAGSMNSMAEELTSLYANLESQVEQRTAQLRAASEVAQLATSSTRLDEILRSTVELVSRRFGYYHAAIFIVDETGSGLLLQEASGEPGEKRKRRSRRISLSDDLIPCLVARQNRTLVNQDTRANPSLNQEDLLPQTRSQASVPISIGANVLGVLDVHSDQPNTFDADTVFVLQTLANQLASALQNTRLLASTQVNLEETNLLYQLTRQIIAAKEKNSVVEILLEALPQLNNSNALLVPKGNNLHILGLYDSTVQKFEQNLSSIDIPSSRYKDTLLKGQAILVEDITQPSQYDNILSFFLRRGCKSAVILPSLQDNDIALLLVLGFRADERIQQHTLQPLVNLAEVITNTFDRFTVLDSLQQRLSELQILATFSQIISTEAELQTLYRKLHALIIETIGSDIGFLVATQDEEKGHIAFPFAFEDGEFLTLAPIPSNQGLISYVLQQRQPLLLERDTERLAMELGAQIHGRPARSWMGVPLIVAGNLVGALVLQDQINEERFSNGDLNLFTTIAPLIAAATRNVQLVDEIKQIRQVFAQEQQEITTWLENTPDVITIKNEHGHYLKASRSIKSYFGIQADKVIGRSDYDLMDAEVASHSTEDELAILQDGRPRIGMLEKHTFSGQDIWFLVTKLPIVTPAGECKGLITIRRDVTEMKNSEDEAKRRATEILTAAEIAREASTTLDIGQLLANSINLVRDRFGFYHASIFLLDALGQNAVLRESTGEAGRTMKENDHQLAVGSHSIVGQAAARGEAVIVHDVKDDPTHLPNPLLPDTNAEMALPLKIGSQVLGVLDVQSTQKNAFSLDDISILSILADQLAVALNNAELFGSTQDMLGKHRLLHQITVAASSAENLTDAMERVVNGLVIARVADRAGVLLVEDHTLEVAALSGYELSALPTTRIAFGQGIIGSAAQERQPVLLKDSLNDPRYSATSEATRSELALPILFAGEVLGVLNLESNSVAAFDLNDQDVMIALTNTIGAIITNWRLVDQIRRQIERQQYLFNAAAKIRRSVDIDTILQTSVDEIAKAMGAQRARIKLNTFTSDQLEESQTQGQGQTGLNSASVSGNGHHGKEGGE
jgi:PAS domain S-box-containing protein